MEVQRQWRSVEKITQSVKYRHIKQDRKCPFDYFYAV